MNRNELDVVILQVLRNWNGNITDKSYGSFDRNYWHYKTLTSFPSATFQQVVAGLSVLIKSNLSPKHCSNLYLTEVTRSAMVYWAAIQNADGSFNEYYKKWSEFLSFL